MITSKQVIDITEKTLKWKQYYGEKVEILENPSSSEVLALFDIKTPDFLREIRLIADADTKKVYVWNAELATHNMVQSDIGYPNLNNKPNLILGMGKLSGGKSLITEWDYSRFYASKSNLDFLGKLFSYNWSWLSSYISNISSFLATEKDKYQKLVKI